MCSLQMFKHAENGENLGNVGVLERWGNLEKIQKQQEKVGVSCWLGVDYWFSDCLVIAYSAIAFAVSFSVGLFSGASAFFLTNIALNISLTSGPQ